jgi:transposase
VRTNNLAEKIEALRQKRGGRAPRRNGHILLLRVTPRKGDALRFLYDPSVPFTNNQAERDGRIRKSPAVPFAGVRDDFAVVRSFFSTTEMFGSLSAFR